VAVKHDPGSRHDAGVGVDELLPVGALDDALAGVTPLYYQRTAALFEDSPRSGGADSRPARGLGR